MLQHFQINFPFFTRSLCSVYLRIKLTILLCTQTHTENDVIFWLGNICTYKMAFLISGFLSCIALSSVWKLSWHLRKNAQCQVIWFWYAIDRPRHVSTSESDLFFIIDQSVSQLVRYTYSRKYGMITCWGSYLSLQVTSDTNDVFSHQEANGAFAWQKHIILYIHIFFCLLSSFDVQGQSQKNRKKD